MAYRILTIITPLITSPIISRALGAEKLGVYSATYAFANYFMLFAMLGVEKYGQRTIASAESQEEKQHTFWEIYFVQFFTSLIAIFAYYITLVGYAGDRKTVIALQGIWVISCLFDINWFFFGCEEFKITVSRNLIVKLLTVVSIILFIKEPRDLNLYVFIMAGGNALSTVILWLSLKKRISFEIPKVACVRRHVLPIIKLFIPVIALSVYHVMDKTMLDLLSTESEVGYYYSADKIIYIPLGLITAIGTVMLPRMSSVLFQNDDRMAEKLLSKSAELTLFLTSAVGFGIASIAEEFVPFFFGKGFERCIVLLYLFIPVLFIKALSDIVRSQYMIPAKKDNIYIIAVVGGAITNVFFNMLLIPKYGAVGAVLGTCAAEFNVMLIQTVGCSKQIHFVGIFVKQGVYLLPGILMFFAVRFFAGATTFGTLVKLLLMIMVGAVVYMLSCMIIWSARKETIFKGYMNKLIAMIKI